MTCGQRWTVKRIAKRIGVSEWVVYDRKRRDGCVRALLDPRRALTETDVVRAADRILARGFTWSPSTALNVCHVCVSTRWKHVAHGMCERCWQWWHYAGRHCDERRFPFAVAERRARLAKEKR